MATRYTEIDASLKSWIEAQHMFFVATAPEGPGGHVNLSPKGVIDSLAILGPHRIGYVDMIGSGVETIAHLRQNGRVTMMFCAFDGPPKIIRIYGAGRFVTRSEAAFEHELAGFSDRVPEAVLRAARALVLVDVDEVWRSCGFTVPRMDFRGQRRQLFDYVDNRERHFGDQAVQSYVDINHSESLDGLPGIDPSREVGEEERALHSHVGRAL